MQLAADIKAPTKVPSEATRRVITTLIVLSFPVWFVPAFITICAVHYWRDLHERMWRENDSPLNVDRTRRLG